MGPAQRVDPVRREQIGARPNARRDERRPAAGSPLGKLFRQDPQGRPRAGAPRLRRPDRRTEGQGARGVPRSLRRRRTLASGLGGSTGHRGPARRRRAPAEPHRIVARHHSAQAAGAGPPFGTRPRRRVEPPQIGLPGQHEPRNPHAAQRHRRVLEHPCRDRRGAGKAGIHFDHREQQRPAPATDRRHPRPLEDRGRNSGIQLLGLRAERTDARKGEHHPHENGRRRRTDLRTGA